MAVFGAAQGAGGEHPDGDDAHVCGFRVRQEIAEIMRRIPRRDRSPGARIEQVIADLRGIEGAGVDHPVERRGVADRGDPVEPGLALFAQPLERRHDLAEHDFRREIAFLAVEHDVVVQLEQIDLLALQPLQARLQRGRDRRRRYGGARRPAPAPWCRGSARASGSSARGRDCAPIRRCRTSPRCRNR